MNKCQEDRRLHCDSCGRRFCVDEWGDACYCGINNAEKRYLPKLQRHWDMICHICFDRFLYRVHDVTWEQAVKRHAGHRKID
jgi:hypothetical protein